MADTNKSKKGTSTTKKKEMSKSHSYNKNNVKSSISKSISESTGIDKKIVSKAVKNTGKLSLSGKIAVVTCLLTGIAIGYFGVRILQRNDQFRLVNGEVFNVNVGEEVDLNELSHYVICVSYGMNAIDSVSVEGVNSLKLNTSAETTYTIKYKSSNIKYKNIVLTQTINVVQVEDSYIGD